MTNKNFDGFYSINFQYTLNDIYKTVEQEMQGISITLEILIWIIHCILEKESKDDRLA